MKQVQIEQEQDSIAKAIRVDLAVGDAGYRAAGEKFTKKKDSLPHGAWLPWLEANGFTVRVAQRTMQLANAPLETHLADLIHPEPVLIPPRRLVAEEAEGPFFSDAATPIECEVPTEHQEMDGFVMSLNLLADNCIAMRLSVLSKGLNGKKYDKSVLVPQVKVIIQTLTNLLKEIEK